uniref:Uncharacterized protein n=1 Tax=Neospora caninum (strain Liverpool) TaxID=572307 RepID=A0A0F7UKB5_NEOCL|nr:TPA: hypothetical protein BN1204_043350 [Neospora caninum Liverpool]
MTKVGQHRSRFLPHVHSVAVSSRENVQAFLPSKTLYQILGQIEGAHTQPRTASVSFMETVNSQLQEARAEVEEKLRSAIDFLRSLKHSVAADTVGWERAAALRTFMARTDVHKVPDPQTVEKSAAIATTILEKLSPQAAHGQNTSNATMPWPTAVTNLQFLHATVVPELSGVVKRIQEAEKQLDGLRMKLRGASFLHHAMGHEIPVAVEPKSTGSQEVCAVQLSGTFSHHEQRHQDKKDDDNVFAVIGGIPFFDL